MERSLQEYFLAEKVSITVRFLTTGSCQHPTPILVFNSLPASASKQDAKNNAVTAL